MNESIEAVAEVGENNTDPTAAYLAIPPHVAIPKKILARAREEIVTSSW
jgi:hypothetical protein